jgi:hypothetical protein
MTRFGLRALPLVVLALALARCGGDQNALAPKSKPEHAISHLWWWTMTGAWIGFAVICGLLFLGWLRRNRTELPFASSQARTASRATSPTPRGDDADARPP